MNCLECNNEISKNKFCNLSCSAKFYNKKRPKRKKTAISFGYCITCNDKINFKIKPGGGFYKRKFCQKCLPLERARKIDSLFNYEDLFLNQTKGSLLSRRKNWQSANSSIRNHSRKVYINSGKELKCEICSYNFHVEICHVKSVKDFSDTDKIVDINSIDNLIALCPNHHWELDNGLLKIL
jgi:hypothetical protein